MHIDSYWHRGLACKARRLAVALNDSKPRRARPQCCHSTEDFCFTLDITDTATGWTESLPLMNKVQKYMFEATKDATEALLCSIHFLESDNASEFINWELQRPLTNHFNPQRRILKKIRSRAKTIVTYELPAIPHQRVLTDIGNLKSTVKTKWVTRNSPLTTAVIPRLVQGVASEPLPLTTASKTQRTSHPCGHYQMTPRGKLRGKLVAIPPACLDTAHARRLY